MVRSLELFCLRPKRRGTLSNRQIIREATSDESALFAVRQGIPLLSDQPMN